MTADSPQPAPLDLAQFEGHAPGSYVTWCVGSERDQQYVVITDRPAQNAVRERATANLLSAAPALLAEVQRLRTDNAQLQYALEQETGFGDRSRAEVQRLEMLLAPVSPTPERTPAPTYEELTEAFARWQGMVCAYRLSRAVLIAAAAPLPQPDTEKPAP